MKKKILFAVEIVVLLLFIGGLYVYGQLNTKLDKVNQSAVDESRIHVNQEVQDAIDSETSQLTGYTTYALFGIDHRDKNPALNTENSDTMIIASVNNDTKDVKLVSVYRDTLLNLGDDTYSKANAAYAYGGAAIGMIVTVLEYADHAEHESRPEYHRLRYCELQRAGYDCRLSRRPGYGYVLCGDCSYEQLLQGDI